MIIAFFENNPNTEFRHAPIDEWVREQYPKDNDDEPQDVRRAVRKVEEKGRLMKVHRGVFKYDPDYDHENNYRCVVCGFGREDGIDIAANHKIARTKNGTNTLENGQTLCYEHNSIKKDHTLTEAAKRYFIDIYKTAVESKDEKLIAFCESVFDAYDEHDMNEHIDRPDVKKHPSLFD